MMMMPLRSKKPSTIKVAPVTVKGREGPSKTKASSGLTDSKVSEESSNV